MGGMTRGMVTAGASALAVQLLLLLGPAAGWSVLPSPSRWLRPGFATVVSAPGSTFLGDRQSCGTSSVAATGRRSGGLVMFYEEGSGSNRRPLPTTEQQEGQQQPAQQQQAHQQQLLQKLLIQDAANAAIEHSKPAPPLYEWLDASAAVEAIPSTEDATAVGNAWVQGVRSAITQAETAFSTTGDATMTELDPRTFMGPVVAPAPPAAVAEQQVSASAAAAAVPVKYAPAKARKPDTMPPSLSPERVPNLWLAVGHSSELHVGKPMKVMVDGKPIAIWRATTGQLHAISDICIHRGASLARGWVHQDRLVCPYHGFEFDGKGVLQYMPGVTNMGRKQSCTGSGRKTHAYLVTERNGWVYLFPDAARPGAAEQYSEPFTIPEASDPSFRHVQGSVEIGGDAAACMENMLDLLHISFVHSFGNLNNPVPFEVEYTHGSDDAHGDLGTTAVTFRYKSGPKSFSKVVGRSAEVVVRNEFHLPYHAVIRVFFGDGNLKTIHASAVPIGRNRTKLHWKLYRNFFMTHPADNGPINAAADAFFSYMMGVTLQEDKDIIESIYPGHQRGYMNAKFDKQVLFWRKALGHFQTRAAERSTMQMEVALQAELLARVARTRRGTDATTADRRAILRLIEQLETVPGTADGSAEVSAEQQPVDAVPQALGGQWHLQYMMAPGGDVVATPAAAALNAEAPGIAGAIGGGGEGVEVGGGGGEAAEVALREAGSEAYLLDWNAKGRPLWADTEESVQIVDTDQKILTNRAVYTGWAGLRTTVQLDAMFKACESNANRLLIQFKNAMVDIGGLRLSFPHLAQFMPRGWLETTYVNDHLRIARGNKGSIFVLTRKPTINASADAAKGSSDSEPTQQ